MKVEVGSGLGTRLLWPEQVSDIAVAVHIQTIGGACQDLGKHSGGGIKIIEQKYQTTSWGVGPVHETRLSVASGE